MLEVGEGEEVGGGAEVDRDCVRGAAEDDFVEVELREGSMRLEREGEVAHVDSVQEAGVRN